MASTQALLLWQCKTCLLNMRFDFFVPSVGMVASPEPHAEVTPCSVATDNVDDMRHPSKSSVIYCIFFKFYYLKKIKVLSVGKKEPFHNKCIIESMFI